MNTHSRMRRIPTAVVVTVAVVSLLAVFGLGAYASGLVVAETSSGFWFSGLAIIAAAALFIVSVSVSFGRYARWMGARWRPAK